MREIHRLLYFYGLSVVVVGFDQLSKSWAQKNLNYAESNELLSWLDFTLHYNPGAAFSIFSEAGGWQRWFFSVIAISVSIVLVLWIYSIRHTKGSLSFGLSLILGGALGNVWDRIQLGYVVDFVSVHFYGWYFPTFNIADSAISVGVFFVLIDGVLTAKQDV